MIVGTVIGVVKLPTFASFGIPVAEVWAQEAAEWWGWTPPPGGFRPFYPEGATCPVPR